MPVLVVSILLSVTEKLLLSTFSRLWLLLHHLQLLLHLLRHHLQLQLHQSQLHHLHHRAQTSTSTPTRFKDLSKLCSLTDSVSSIWNATSTEITLSPLPMLGHTPGCGSDLVPTCSTLLSTLLSI